MTIIPFVSIGTAAPTVSTAATASAASRARDTMPVAVLCLVSERKGGAQRSKNNTGRVERDLFTHRYECRDVVAPVIPRSMLQSIVYA